MEQSKKTSFDFYMLPLVLAVAVVPLLTMMTAYSSGIGKYTCCLLYTSDAADD